MKKLKYLFLCIVTCLFVGNTFADNNSASLETKAVQQTERVTGTVFDESGPLIGASVFIKGTSRGVVTDQDGKFTLNAQRGETFVVSFLGYIPQEFIYNGEAELSITLREDAQKLGEVVVTALGIKREAKALGYGMTTIQASDIIKTATPNFATSLYGKVPGVRVQAAPGGTSTAVSITVRGLSSILLNTQPLVIMNGIPIRNGNANDDGYWTDQRIRSNGLIDINPEDIESLTVLKGAAASALYGSEAANGVVMITTKSGTVKQGIGVEVSAGFTSDKVAYMPKYQTVYGPGVRVGGRTTGYNQDSGGFLEREWKGQKYRSIQSTNAVFGPKYDGEDILYFDGTVRPYEAIGDPWSETFRTAHNQNYNIAITQGNENGNMRLAYTHVNSTPNQYNSDYNKNNFSLNGSYILNKNLKIDYNANYIVQYIKNRPYRISRLTNNFGGMANAWTDVKYIRENTITSRGYRNVLSTGRTPTPDEAFAYDFGVMALVDEYFWNIFGKEEHENNNRLLASVTPTWQIIDGLKLQGRIATDYTIVKIENKEKTERPLAYDAPWGSGYYALHNRNFEEIYGDIILMFDKKITESLGIVANAGWMGRTEKMSYSRINTDRGLSVENWFHINSSFSAARSEQKMSDFLKTGLFAALGLSYNNCLYLEGTIRQEKISTLAKGSNTFYYPSMNASFIYTEALKNALPSWYDYGKLRLSYGVVGNAPEIYQAAVAYEQSTASGYVYNLIPNVLGNLKLTPETKYETEIGWENKMFGNRLGFEFSFYHNIVKSQILPTSLPITIGGSNMMLNVGELKNQGIEFSVYGTPIQTKDYFWEVRANLVSNKNSVTKLAEGLPMLTHSNIDNGAVTIESHEGEPMGDIYAFDVKKDENGNAIIGDDGFGILTEERVKVGNAMPKVTGGFSTSFGYKNLVLDLVLDFRIGGSIVNVPYEYLMGRGSLVESMKWRDAENGGMSYYFKDNNHSAGICVPYNGKAGDRGPNNEIVYDNGMILDGVKQDGSKNDIMLPSDWWYNWTYNWGTDKPTYYAHSIFDNTYCKVREIVLSYNLPKSLTSKFSCRNLTVSVFGRNLFYLYKNLPIFDVEATDGTHWFSQAQIGGSTATTRTFGVSLRASF